MNEQDIPIDIHSNKLLDWLTSRRHCNKDWYDKILIIREKINNAIQDMPAHEGIVKLLSGSHINYFHCLKIIEILKKTEADTKNLFGRYGSQRMKDWQEIISLYQKDNVYLAEAAQILMRNVNYEVPSLKKQIQKLEQMQNDCNKKAKDYAKNENIAFNEFNASCKQLKIDGKNIKKELVKLLDELPEIYEKISVNFKYLKPALELYNTFLEFNSGKKNEVNSLLLLEYVSENGNTTTYEWMYGEKPIKLEPPIMTIIDNSEKATASNEIDFGDLGGGGEIEFGDLGGDINLDGIKLEEGDIDWGNLDTQEPIDEQNIDYNIALEESGIVIEKEGLEGGIASGNDAYRLLDNPRTRNQIIDELMELKAFLKMRLLEMSSENDILSISQMQNAPDLLQMQTIEGVTSMMDAAENILREIVDKRIMHLHNIKHSSKYIDTLTNMMKQKTAVVERMQTMRKVTLDRAEEYRQQALSIKPIIALIIEKTKTLQNEIELEISKKYKNRVVNMIGGVNAL